MTLHQAMLAMGPIEGQVAGSIQDDYEAPLQTGCVQYFHADQPLHHPRAQLGVRSGARMADEMLQRLMDRSSFLPRLRQAVQVGQDLRVAHVEVEVELSARPELEQVQTDAPPDEETLVVGDEGLKTSVWEMIQPSIELRPEMANGPHQFFA